MRTVQWFVAVFVASVLVTGAGAGTLDRRLVAVSGGIVQLGGDLDDLSDVLDTIYTYGINVQLPLGDYLALLGGIQRSTTSLDADDVDGDITVLGFTGGVRLHVPLRELPVTPFVAALYSHSINELEVKDEGERIKAELTEGSIIISAGVELSLTDRLSLIGSFARVMEQSSDLKVNGEKITWDDAAGESPLDDKDDLNVISASVNFWLTDSLLIAGLAGYELDNKTKTYQASIGFSF